MSRPTRQGTSVNEPRVNTIVNMYHLDDIDKKILKFKIRYKDITLGDLGQEVGISVSAVSERIGKPAFQIAWEEYNIPLDKLVKSSATKALRVLNAIMDDRTLDADVRIRACKTVLDVVSGPKSIIISNLDATQSTESIYRTTVQPDGSLLGEVIDLELGTDAERPLTFNVPQKEIKDDLAKETVQVDNGSTVES